MMELVLFMYKYLQGGVRSVPLSTGRIRKSEFLSASFL